MYGLIFISQHCPCEKQNPSSHILIMFYRSKLFIFLFGLTYFVAANKVAKVKINCSDLDIPQKEICDNFITSKLTKLEGLDVIFDDGMISAVFQLFLLCSNNAKLLNFYPILPLLLVYCSMPYFIFQ